MTDPCSCGWRWANLAGDDCDICGAPLLWTRMERKPNRSGVGLIDPMIACPKCNPDVLWPE